MFTAISGPAIFFLWPICPIAMLCLCYRSNFIIGLAIW